MSHTTNIKQIPFDPKWLDENGYITNAWDALAEHPEADKLVGMIEGAKELFEHRDHSGSSLVNEHIPMGLFTISKKKITQTLTYHKLVEYYSYLNGALTPGSSGRTLAVGAVARIAPNEVRVFHNVNESRGRASLLESWARCDVVAFTEPQWVLTERNVQRIYTMPFNWQGAVPLDFHHFMVEINSHLAYWINKNEPVEDLKENNQYLKDRVRWTLKFRDEIGQQLPASFRGPYMNIINELKIGNLRYVKQTIACHDRCLMGHYNRIKQGLPVSQSLFDLSPEEQGY